MTVVVFSLVFGRLAKVPSDGIPYAVFSMAALAPWTFFSNSVTNCAHSLLSNSALVKKVYFPRLIVPASTLLAGVVDLGISIVLLLLLSLFYGIIPGPKILLLPLFLLVAAAAALGFGLWLGALNVQYRDVAFVIGFLMQLWTYATPVVWPVSSIPERWRVWIGLNPMAGVIQGFRWALFEGQESPWAVLAVSSVVSSLVLVSGAYYFRRVDKEFADLA